MEFVSLVYQYRNLLGRRDVLHQALSEDQQERLRALEQLFEWRLGRGSSILPGQLRRRMARCLVHVPALLATHGNVTASTIVDLGGDGFALAGAPPLSLGDPVVVVVQDLRSGMEYRFPAEVRWSRPEHQPAAGVRFDGLPVQIRHRHWAPAADYEAA